MTRESPDALSVAAGVSSGVTGSVSALAAGAKVSSADAEEDASGDGAGVLSEFPALFSASGLLEEDGSGLVCAFPVSSSEAAPEASPVSFASPADGVWLAPEGSALLMPAAGLSDGPDEAPAVSSVTSEEGDGSGVPADPSAEAGSQVPAASSIVSAAARAFCNVFDFLMLSFQFLSCAGSILL